MWRRIPAAGFPNGKQIASLALVLSCLQIILVHYVADAALNAQIIHPNVAVCPLPRYASDASCMNAEYVPGVCRPPSDWCQYEGGLISFVESSPIYVFESAGRVDVLLRRTAGFNGDGEVSFEADWNSSAINISFVLLAQAPFKLNRNSEIMAVPWDQAGASGDITWFNYDGRDKNISIGYHPTCHSPHRYPALTKPVLLPVCMTTRSTLQV
eukprot:894272-Rhodomonas_salina.1